MRQSDEQQEEIKRLKYEKNVYRRALRKIAKDYVPEGTKQDCPGCDYDGCIQSVVHHPECVYVLARKALLNKRPK